MMNWFKKEMPVVQMPAEAPPVVDIEKKIADGVKAALYSAKHKEVQAKLKDLYLTYVPVGPRYKIRQHPEGGCVILERKVVHKNISEASKRRDYYDFSAMPTLEELEVFDPTPVEKYSTLCMLDAAGMRVHRRFKDIMDAEYYMYRMAEPERYETWYTGDPLNRL